MGAASRQPVFLIIQGRLAPGGEDAYGRYLAGTRPLLARYGAEIVAVGDGLADPHTTGAWPINAVLRFPDQLAASGFLADPDYIEIKQRYRDVAYEVLHLAMFAGRPPRT